MSQKNGENFEAVAGELLSSSTISEEIHLTAYDTDTRRCSIFHMFNQSYEARKEFQMEAQRTADLKEHSIAEIPGERLNKVRQNAIAAPTVR